MTTIGIMCMTEKLIGNLQPYAHIMGPGGMCMVEKLIFQLGHCAITVEPGGI